MVENNVNKCNISYHFYIQFIFSSIKYILVELTVICGTCYSYTFLRLTQGYYGLRNLPEMTSVKKGRSECDNLQEWQRNCLLWPDFQEWGESKTMEIKKDEETGELGIISIVLQVRNTESDYENNKQPEGPLYSFSRLKTLHIVIILSRK